MQFNNPDGGEYSSHAGSLKIRSCQEYLAVVIVNRPCDSNLSALEHRRDRAVSGGHQWLISEEARPHAFLVGVAAVTEKHHYRTGETLRSMKREPAHV